MSSHSIQTLPSKAPITSLDGEIAIAMRKMGATPEEMIFADTEHLEQAYELLLRLGAGPRLLGIVASINDDMDSNRVINRLHRWNADES